MYDSLIFLYPNVLNDGTKKIISNFFSTLKQPKNSLFANLAKNVKNLLSMPRLFAKKGKNIYFG